MTTRVISVTVTAKGVMEILFEDNPGDEKAPHGTVDEQVSAMLRPHVKKYGFVPSDWTRDKLEKEFAMKVEPQSDAKTDLIADADKYNRDNR
jgi:hypothetical protein